MLRRPWTLILLSTLACGGGDASAPAPGTDATVSVRVNPSAVALVTGGAQQLTAVALDATGAPRSGRTVAWSSSAPALASVNSAGIVVALGAGTAVITASIDNRSAGALVTITDPPPAPVASVLLTPVAVALQVGEVRTLAVITRDSAARVLAGRTVTWTSSSPSVAVASPSGIVTGVGVGTAVITAVSEGKSANATITVSAPAPVTTVSLTPTLATVDVGSTLGLVAALRDAAGTVLQNRVVEWTSSDPAIASVSATGVVTGLAAGKSTITATSEGRFGVTIVTVRAP